MRWLAVPASKQYHMIKYEISEGYKNKYRIYEVTYKGYNERVLIAVKCEKTEKQRRTGPNE